MAASAREKSTLAPCPSAAEGRPIMCRSARDVEDVLTVKNTSGFQHGAV